MIDHGMAGMSFGGEDSNWRTTALFKRYLNEYLGRKECYGPRQSEF